MVELKMAPSLRSLPSVHPFFLVWTTWRDNSIVSNLLKEDMVFLLQWIVRKIIIIDQLSHECTLAKNIDQ